MSKMRKDTELEKRFDSYRDAVTPSYDVVEKAKAAVARKKKTKGVLKWALPSACAVVAICLVLGLVIGYTGGLSDKNSAPSDFVARPISFGDADFTTRALDIYSSLLPADERFVQDLDMARNAAVCDATACYKDSELKLVKIIAETVIGGHRSDADIRIQYGSGDYETLNSYRAGKYTEFRAVPVYLSSTTLDGDPVQQIYFEYTNKKYYLTVVSADTTAYLNYLALIIR